MKIKKLRDAKMYYDRNYWRVEIFLECFDEIVRSCKLDETRVTFFYSVLPSCKLHRLFNFVLSVFFLDL